MTFRSIISWSVSSLLLAARVLAEPLPYRAAFDVQEVGTNAGGWRVAGAVADDTVAGFDGWGVRTNFLVACESSLGDVDLYRIESIVTQGVAWLDCVVSYRGTGTVARVGAPTFGQALVCYAAGTNDIPLTQYAGPSGPSMYLKDALAAVALARLAAGIGTGGTGGAGGGGGSLNWPDLTNRAWTAGSELKSATGSNLITRAMAGGPLWMTLTNNTVLAFDLDTFPTNGVSEVQIAIKMGAFSLGASSVSVTNFSSLYLPGTTRWQEILFRKTVNAPKFDVRQ
jgi:hypothetical protein